MPLACLWREEGVGRYYYVKTPLLLKGWLQNQSRLFRLSAFFQGGYTCGYRVLQSFNHHFQASATSTSTASTFGKIRLQRLSMPRFDPDKTQCFPSGTSSVVSWFLNFSDSTYFFHLTGARVQVKETAASSYSSSLLYSQVKPQQCWNMHWKAAVVDLIYESMPCQVRPISMRKTEGTGNAHDADLVRDSPMRELVRNLERNGWSWNCQ